MLDKNYFFVKRFHETENFPFQSMGNCRSGNQDTSPPLISCRMNGALNHTALPLTKHNLLKYSLILNSN
jgi:hypothetical protein